jgi:tetratricopeptide (TPR) repeat protein
MARRCAALILLVLSLLLSSAPAHARQVVTTEEEREHRAAEMKGYRALVDGYRTGDKTAVPGILQWEPKRLEAIVAIVGTSDDPSRLWTADQLRTATMLHTDAALDRLYEDERRVGFELHVASRLLQKGGSPLHAFGRDWYSVVSRTLRSVALFTVAERFLEDGRKRQPNDAALLYETGLLQEHTATFAAFIAQLDIPVGPLPRPGGPLQSQGPLTSLAGAHPSVAEARRALRSAAEWFQDALALDNSVELAQLHLGRVQMLRGDRQAPKLLERLTTSLNADTAYLATMFLAAAEARNERLGASERWYRAAIAKLPSAQSAYVGLSETLLKLGRGDESRATLRTLLERPANSVTEPWWWYLSDPGDELRRRLSALRDRVRQ